ncbi:hypothetical protein AcW2_001045 [Taiwanofungus camphoratus]|nr:hypothetical protein AcW2_001045 [Antrodia cinnamomea]
MELDWETRPLPIHKSRDWHTAQDAVDPSSTAASSSALVSRRRSIVLHAAPPGPPPSQPIPSVPPLTTSQYATYDRLPDASEFQNGTGSQLNPYTRPAASANLAAVAAFSQARFAAVSSSSASPSLSPPSSPDNLSDSPPPSMLRPISTKQPPHTQDIKPDRLLLSPPEPRPSESRPSSRRALTRALELAREAVKLDSTNDDPYGAVVAYSQSVALLSEVMERVMRGEDSTESRRRQNGRRRSVVAQEEEVRRLKSIHDTYADRMNILSLIYSIPLPPHSPPSTYTSSSISASSNSTRPSTPSSTSPSSEISEPSSAIPSLLHRPSRDEPRHSSETARADRDADDEIDGAEVMGTALSTSAGRPMRGVPSPNPGVHPYASTSSPVVQDATLPSSSNRASTTVPAGRRPRASSTLPPPAPPPTSLPPPAPAPAIVEPLPDKSSSSLLRPADISRSRGSSVSHSRTPSGSRLEALQEEVEKSDGLLSPTKEIEIGQKSSLLEESNRSRSRDGLFTSHGSSRDSHPLPPLPSPSSQDSASTPRNPPTAAAYASEPSSPYISQFTTPRPRGGSTFSVRSDMATPTNRPLINTSPMMGTISQRRTKTSAPPSTNPSSPTDSTATTASVPTMSRLNVSTLPASTVSSLGIGGRDRAWSQPGRRPSLASANPYPSPSVGTPGSAPVPRKPSFPSRLNPYAPPQISINTAMSSPPLGTSAMTPLVPPPPIPHGNIPTAPLSPLPSLAPPDPLRKPYHMMSLLRQTMISKTGGYITRRLHVPQEVWSQGGAKLTNIPEKIRVVEVLCSALEELQNWSVDYFGAGNVSSGMALGIGSIGRKEGEAWASKLEDFTTVCDGVVSNFGKKLGVGEGFVTKKSSGVTSWGGKLTRQFDKFTNGKNLDSPAIYVQGLAKLFQRAQILDEHTKAATSAPAAALYVGFPIDIRSALELKLGHASEFFAKVVLTFVIGDLALLLDKYVKKCEKWLAE